MQPQPNALERFLPTAGGLLGSLVGGVIGGGGGVAAGAAVPGADLTGVPEVAGGAMGARLGSTAGAGIGGGIGQGLEDFATSLFHQQGAPKTAASAIPGIAASAGENALGNAAGEGLNWLGGKALGGATDFLGSLVGKRADQTAQAVDNVPWQGIAGSAAAKNSNLEGTLGVMKNYGISTNPDDLAAVTPQVTGKDGAVVSDLVRGGMAKSTNPVDITGTVDLANNMASSPQMATEGPTVGKAFVNSVNSILGLGKGGTLTNNAASDIYEARQQLMDQAYSKGTGDTLSSAYHDLAQSLDGALTRSGVDNVVSDTGITPEQFETLHNISPQLANDATAASQQGVGALRSLQKSFVDASNLVKAQAYHAGGQLPGAIENKVAQATPKGLSALDALSLGAALPTHGASLLGLLPHGFNLAGNPAVQAAALNGLKSFGASNIATKVLPALTKLGAIGAANIPNEASQPQNPNPEMSDPNGQSNQTTGGAGVQPQLSPLEQFVLQQQQLQGGMAVQEEKAPMLASSLAGPMASMGSTVGGLMPQVQQQEQQASILGNLPTSYANAGGAQGTIGGLMTQAQGLIPGSPAAQYQASQQAAAAMLAQKYGMSVQEAMRILPQLTQSATTAAGPQSMVQNLLQNMGPTPQQASALGGF